MVQSYGRYCGIPRFFQPLMNTRIFQTLIKSAALIVIILVFSSMVSAQLFSYKLVGQAVNDIAYFPITGMLLQEWGGARSQSDNEEGYIDK